MGAPAPIPSLRDAAATVGVVAAVAVAVAVSGDASRGVPGVGIRRVAARGFTAREPARDPRRLVGCRGRTSLLLRRARSRANARGRRSGVVGRRALARSLHGRARRARREILGGVREVTPRPSDPGRRGGGASVRDPRRRIALVVARMAMISRRCFFPRQHARGRRGGSPRVSRALHLGHRGGICRDSTSTRGGRTRGRVPRPSRGAGPPARNVLRLVTWHPTWIDDGFREISVLFFLRMSNVAGSVQILTKKDDEKVRESAAGTFARRLGTKLLTRGRDAHRDISACAKPNPTTEPPTFDIQHDQSSP